MNVGELNERITILELIKDGMTYSWKQNSTIWAKCERLNASNLFYKIGLGTRSIKFTIRKRKGLTLHNAFLWQGKHCFLTDVKEFEQSYYEITAALVNPQNCSVEQTGDPTLNELNRPVYGNSVNLVFPGCLVEKYIGHTQGAPMAFMKIRYVLVTPKSINLNIGELLTIDEVCYTVLIPHTLDEYKNEYEIKVKEDI